MYGTDEAPELGVRWLAAVGCDELRDDEIHVRVAGMQDEDFRGGQVTGTQVDAELLFLPQERAGVEPRLVPAGHPAGMRHLDGHRPQLGRISAVDLRVHPFPD